MLCSSLSVRSLASGSGEPVSGRKRLELTRHEVDSLLAVGNLSYQGVDLVVVDSALPVEREHPYAAREEHGGPGPDDEEIPGVHEIGTANTVPVEREHGQEDARVSVGLSRIGPHGPRRSVPNIGDDQELRAVNEAYRVMCDETNLPDDFDAAQAMAMAAIQGYAVVEREHEGLKALADSRGPSMGQVIDNARRIEAEFRGEREHEDAPPKLERWMVDYEHAEGESQHAVLSWLDGEASDLPDVGDVLVRLRDVEHLLECGREHEVSDAERVHRARQAFAVQCDEDGRPLNPAERFEHALVVLAAARGTSPEQPPDAGAPSFGEMMEQARLAPLMQAMERERDAARSEVERRDALRLDAFRQILDLRDTEWATDPDHMDQRIVAQHYARKLEQIWAIAATQGDAR